VLPDSRRAAATARLARTPGGVDRAICTNVLTASKPRCVFGAIVLRLYAIALLRITAARDISAGAAKKKRLENQASKNVCRTMFGCFAPCR
jgi:hypothetical protein